MHVIVAKECSVCYFSHCPTPEHPPCMADASGWWTQTSGVCMTVAGNLCWFLLWLLWLTDCSGCPTFKKYVATHLHLLQKCSIDDSIDPQMFNLVSICTDTLTGGCVTITTARLLFTENEKRSRKWFTLNVITTSL